MSIDWTLNLGHLLTIGGFLFGGLMFMLTIRNDVNSIKTSEGTVVQRLEIVERDLAKITDVLVSLARQDERLNSHGRRLDALDDRIGTLERTELAR